MKKFADLVEEVKTLSFEDKEELLIIVKDMIIQERRNEILRDHEDTLKELKEGKLVFYASIEDIMKVLNS